jgi:hypothetical protein
LIKTSISTTTTAPALMNIGGNENNAGGSMIRKQIRDRETSRLYENALHDIKDFLNKSNKRRSETDETLENRIMNKIM